MGEEKILAAMKEAVRTAICEAANEEIRKQQHRFECEMGKVKREVVGRLVNQIQITACHHPINGEYVIQLRLHGGDN
jgi:hypothetical protein